MLRSLKKIDLLLLELFLGRNSTLSAMSEIMRFHPDINVLVISTASGNIYANRVLNEGAKGFINNSEDAKLIEKAIRMVSEGDYFVSQEIYIHSLCKAEKKTKGKNPFDVLSNKEIDIVHYLLQGMTTSEISDQARLAVSTVSTYKMRIFQKLQVNNLISLSELAATYEVV
jgi:two-component system invasion response regulator UvrY